MTMRKKPRVLLVAEAVTLAHFARIMSLARALDSADYEVIVATDPRYLQLEASLPFSIHPIWSTPGPEFAASLARGKPLYDVKTLSRYVEDDLALLDQVKPDLVVGDFRLSLAVSAPLRQVPYAAVVNAYWSPYAATVYPVPDLPITRYLGVNLAQRVFNAVRPLAFALHARPLNRVRRRHGLPALGSDLRAVYSWGNYTLYPDVPELFPTRDLPANHHYLGPVTWSAKTTLPDWWDTLPDDRPIVFVTLGSSGQADLLPLIFQALAELPVTVIAATVGSILPGDQPPNVFIADFLPMGEALGRARGQHPDGLPLGHREIDNRILTLLIYYLYPPGR
jgi:UDP:flavonoid glycosyltransferase YjiC (YdhE family)